MFTGIVSNVGRLESRIAAEGGARLRIRPATPLVDLEVGESLAVNGVCLTCEVGSQPDRPVLFVSSETLARTTLGRLAEGARVNLERALRPTDRLGGHFVLGHVDAVGRIRRWVRRGEAWRLEVEHPASLAPTIASKGSISVDGISLTVVEAQSEAFSLAVIPQTVEATTLVDAAEGASVNLEVDVLARYVVQALAHGVASVSGDLSTDLLGRAGFLDSSGSLG